MINASITQLLDAWKGGDRSVENQLASIIYPVLRDIARAQSKRHSGPLTMAPTELVHEAYERLHRQRSVDWKNRGHFYAVAATVIRRVIVDHLRRRLASKRGGDVVMVDIDAPSFQQLAAPDDGVDWLALNQALELLMENDADCARVAEMRLFSGMTVEQIAEAMGSSTATVGRQWRFASVWLADRLDTTGARVVDRQQD